jgi:hypothetical protein
MDEHPEPRGEDDELIARLKVAAERLDPVPPSVRTGGRAAFAWRNIDNELELLTLEQTDGKELTGVRSTAVGRFFTLGCDHLVVELEMFPEADGSLSLQGLALLAPVARVEVRSLDGVGSTISEVGRGGRFSFDAVQAGPLKLVFHDDDGPKFASEWLTF